MLVPNSPFTKAKSYCHVCVEHEVIEPRDARVCHDLY